MTDLAPIISPEPRLNTTIRIANASVVPLLARAGLTPRLYAQSIGGNGYLIPLKKYADPFDDSVLIDPAQDLTTLGVSDAVPISLNFRCIELGYRMFNCAQSIHMLLSPDPITGLVTFVSILSLGEKSDSKVLALLDGLPGVKAAAAADLIALVGPDHTIIAPPTVAVVHHPTTPPPSKPAVSKGGK